MGELGILVAFQFCFLFFVCGLRVNAPYKARLTKQITKKINGMNGWLDGIGYDCNETIELRL